MTGPLAEPALPACRRRALILARAQAYAPAMRLRLDLVRRRSERPSAKGRPVQTHSALDSATNALHALVALPATNRTEAHLPR